MYTNQVIAPSKKILRHPALLALLRSGVRLWPVMVEFDPSDACNLNCEWCAFNHLHGGQLMDWDLGRCILDQLAETGVRAITFSGGGEPTVNPDFERIVSYAAGLGLQLGLYTNGLLLNRVASVLDHFAWVYVSLDAVDEAAYRRAKGVDRFDKVTANVERLASLKHDTTLGLGFLLGCDNWRYCEEMAALGLELAADYVHFRPAVWGGDYSWVPSALSLLDDLEGERVFVSRQRFLDLYHGREHDYDICRGSELVPCIGADGTLWVCPNTRGIRSLGDLKEHTFAELWQRRPVQRVGPDCRAACRNHFLNQTLDYVCGSGPHDDFV